LKELDVNKSFGTTAVQSIKQVPHPGDFAESLQLQGFARPNKAYTQLA